LASIAISVGEPNVSTFKYNYVTLRKIYKDPSYIESLKHIFVQEINKKIPIEDTCRKQRHICSQTEGVSEDRTQNTTKQLKKQKQD
jgi:hypothetical protein